MSGNGTLDHAAYLTIPDGITQAYIIQLTCANHVIIALKFREWMGGEERINAYCRDIAFRGGQVLAKILGTQILDPTGDMTLNMVTRKFEVSF